MKYLLLAIKRIVYLRGILHNTEDLSPYAGPEDGSPRGKNEASLPPTLRLREEIEDIVDHQIISTRNGGYQRYLVKWKGRPLSDCTWITDQDFQKLNLDLYEQFHAINSSGPSFSKPGGIDAKWKQPLKTYQRKENPKSKAQTLIWHDLGEDGLIWDL